ncbi:MULTISPECIES: hypothetical protein [unclassified Bradyrhizobium]|uniref:hypothetical protein n=1 Tax=unclassified Bradyrhizobium TaxID=2631580 RepID=UPI00180364C3|nr:MULTISPECIES: hypothetical protein [unclassified Bradyrhizobium]MBB4262915.1 hypothetical protein [Bradyrhizobium sp. CIR3A]NYG47171.1 hypothetical protein [Bradyrhizobium sp. IAR9]
MMQRVERSYAPLIGKLSDASPNGSHGAAGGASLDRWKICESIAVTEVNIGKWYDPISERWIVPREARAIAGYGQSGAEKVPESHERREAQRIWELLVDCCAGE